MLLRSSNIVRAARTTQGLLFERNGDYRIAHASVRWRDISAQDNLHVLSMRAHEQGASIGESEALRLVRECNDVLAELPFQVIAAFGVTFQKSELARDEEFGAAGDARVLKRVEAPATAERKPDTPYTRVGDPNNPAEMFLKGVKRSHAFKHGQKCGIRPNAERRAVIEGVAKFLKPWSVHEPEIGTWVTPNCCPVAFTPALDPSCRVLEGIGLPLLLKAKMFRHCAGMGEWATIPENPLDFWKLIRVRSWAERGGVRVWPMADEPDFMLATQCRRQLPELCLDMGDSDLMADGEAALFMSGTGIVPAVGKNDDFSLLPGDEIRYECEQLGPLDCTVEEVPYPIRTLPYVA